MTIDRTATLSSISSALQIPVNCVIGKTVTVRDRLLALAFSECERKMLELWLIEMPGASGRRNEIQFNKPNFAIGTGGAL